MTSPVSTTGGQVLMISVPNGSAAENGHSMGAPRPRETADEADLIPHL